MPSTTSRCCTPSCRSRSIRRRSSSTAERIRARLSASSPTRCSSRSWRVGPSSRRASQRSVPTRPTVPCTLTYISASPNGTTAGVLPSSTPSGDTTV
ncbi:hypothetical protein [Nocardiopsis sp. CNT-189]|uniref:hypothetical protein n=1 Tax=Nocardiopsis oceanisediminis TaxID=2816862 RepID=UPI003B3B9FE4